MPAHVPLETKIDGMPKKLGRCIVSKKCVTKQHTCQHSSDVFVNVKIWTLCPYDMICNAWIAFLATDATRDPQKLVSDPMRPVCMQQAQYTRMSSVYGSKSS